MLEEGFQYATKLERLLQKCSYAYHGTQGLIRMDPCKEISDALNFVLAENPGKKKEILHIEDSLIYLKGKNLDTILEDKDSKTLLDSIIKKIENL